VHSSCLSYWAATQNGCTAKVANTDKQKGLAVLKMSF